MKRSLGNPIFNAPMQLNTVKSEISQFADNFVDPVPNQDFGSIKLTVPRRLKRRHLSDIPQYEFKASPTVQTGIVRSRSRLDLSQIPRISKPIQIFQPISA